MRITLFILNHRYVPFQLHHLSIMASHHFPDYPIPSLYQEFYAAYGEDKRNAWRDYFTFGGMPLVLAQKTSEDKSRYLHSLFDKIYLDDIMFRHNIVNEKIVLDDLLDIVPPYIFRNFKNFRSNGRRFKNRREKMGRRKGRRQPSRKTRKPLRPRRFGG